MNEVSFFKIARLILMVFLMTLVPTITNLSRVHAASTGLQPHTSILINGNDEFTQDNGVTGGSGASNDPYVITGWNIQTYNNGIEIANTTAYFTITDVTVSGFNGIVLSSAQNGVVQNSQIYGERGIRVEDSQDFQITGNTISGDIGISLYTATSFDVSYNALQGGAFTIRGSYLSNASFVGNTGNAEEGIELDHLSGLLIGQNQLYGHESIHVESCADTTIDSNNASAHDDGVYIANCDNIQVSNNDASNIAYGQGIYLVNSDGITITSNILSNNPEGIRLVDHSTANSVTTNAISNNQCGIRTDSTSSPDQNYVADNTFTGNIQDYCTFATQSPWPMSHQNAQHTGLSPFPGPTAPVLKWAFQTSGQVEAAPAIGNGIIYVGSTDGNLYALNLQGQLIWKFQTPSPIGTTPAIGSDGTIYLASSIRNSSGYPEGILYAISSAGRMIWNVTLANFQGYDSLSSPTIGSDGTIYTSDVGFRTLAVNPDGTVMWVLQTGGEVFDSPAVGQDGTLYVATDDDNPSPTVVCGQCVAALNPDGTVKWNLRPGGGFGFPAVGSDGTVYVNGVAISSNGTLEWQDRPFVSPSIGTDGTIYGTGNQGLFAINQDGSTRWRFPTETEGGSGDPCCSYDLVQESSVAIGSNGILYFGDWFDHYCSCAPEPSGYGNATVYAVNQDGTQAWNFVIQPTIACSIFPCPTLSLSDPAIGSDGTLYIGSGDGNLYAIGQA